ncbi:hypothetical protein GCM10007868_30830 [Gluconobacter frateurii]|uniref:Uncharacterized protein n=1 Tax=Gluconobacter frateurii NRIC 0228 TaxID=1307946 RepID=A0ABQ0QDG0_9PROT|nr:hypothetical protein AA0228_2178 [Gluconobacter frateurii NRIC 0228]GLP92008.1 hypothetical protein GCM10007868_30830 [Gluconobacter frateurii]
MKQQILAGLTITAPISTPLFLIGCGVGVCLSASLGFALGGIVYMLIFAGVTK